MVGSVDFGVFTTSDGPPHPSWRPRPRPLPRRMRGGSLPPARFRCSPAASGSRPACGGAAAVAAPSPFSCCRSAPLRPLSGVSGARAGARLVVRGEDRARAAVEAVGGAVGLSVGLSVPRGPAWSAVLGPPFSCLTSPRPGKALSCSPRVAGSQFTGCPPGGGGVWVFRCLYDSVSHAKVSLVCYDFTPARDAVPPCLLLWEQQVLPCWALRYLNACVFWNWSPISG